MSGKKLLTFLIMSCLATVGCNGKKEKEMEEKSASVVTDASDLIAVIDLNAVAREIGASTKIDLALKKHEEELVSQFNGLKAELGRRVGELQSANDDLNDQKQNQLDELTADNSAKLTMQAQAAQTQLSTHHSKLKQQLLNQIRPVAYEVAKERGMQLVLTVSQVYAAGPEVNITEEVIKRIKHINDSAQSKAVSKQEVPRVAVKLPGGGEFMPRR